MASGSVNGANSSSTNENNSIVCSAEKDPISSDSALTSRLEYLESVFCDTTYIGANSSSKNLYPRGYNRFLKPNPKVTIDQLNVLLIMGMIATPNLILIVFSLHMTTISVYFVLRQEMGSIATPNYLHVSYHYLKTTVKFPTIQ